jgi:hypothetical protein
MNVVVSDNGGLHYRVEIRGALVQTNSLMGLNMIFPSIQPVVEIFVT